MPAGTISEMTARQPRRTQRRSIPSAALPRPVAGEGEQLAAVATETASARATRRGPAARAHHVTNDYSYVRTDLLTVAAIGVVVVGFILGMSFLI